METGRFDQLARLFASRVNRRLGAASLLSVLVAARIAPDGDAAESGRHGHGQAKANAKRDKNDGNQDHGDDHDQPSAAKTKKKCKSSQKKCGKKCIPKTGCCTSATCTGGKTCQHNVCACPTGTHACNGTCLPGNTCCSDADCNNATTGKTCQSGTCACPVDRKECNNACIATSDCCVDADCDNATTGQTCQAGTCKCPADQKDCNGKCIADSACCDDADCDNATTGQTCQSGSCACPGGQKLCDGSCIPNTACCTDDDCGANAKCCGSVCTDIRTVQNCGACNNVCPGYGTPFSNVTCGSGGVCTFSCQGEHYDVNGNVNDGCEVADLVTGNHIQSNALSLGSLGSCDDTSTQTFSGTIVSDKRVHENPAIVGFDTTSGSAPDWYKVLANGAGAICKNDAAATIRTSGGGSGVCYRLIVMTDKTTQSVTISGANASGVTISNMDYSSNTTIYFKVEKICSVSVTETVSYSVTFHL